LDTGAAAENFEKETREQKMKPAEQELFRLEKITEELLKDLDDMRKTEANMRDVNGKL
jgi:hypothetical protein